MNNYFFSTFSFLVIICMAGADENDWVITMNLGINSKSAVLETQADNGLMHTEDTIQETEADNGFILTEDTILEKQAKNGLMHTEVVEVVDEIDVKVNTSHIVNTVEDYFLSYTIDFSILSGTPRWRGFNFSSPKLHTLLNGLSPAILRVGGSSADSLFFDASPAALRAAQLKPKANYLTKDDVVNLVQLTRATNTRLLIDLNLQQRFGEQWDPSNAIALMDYCAQQGFGENIDWEVGNEPDWYMNLSRAEGQIILTAEQIARDISRLHSIVRTYKNLVNSSVVGPDVGNVQLNAGFAVVQTVANVTGSFLRAITFHHYYFNGKTADYREYLNPKLFSSLAQNIDAAKRSIADTKYPSLPIWLGETSDAYDGGTVNVSDRFVSGFLWLDKLGLSARWGVNVVMRQVLYPSNYGLLGRNLEPNPDYWLSFVHKKLVGWRVFDLVTSPPQSETTRIYALCTRASAAYKAGAVTVFVLNVSPNIIASISFKTAPLAQGNLDLYLFQPGEGSGIGSVLSSRTRCNGVQLVMLNDTSMPVLVPVIRSAAQPVTIPPLSFAFLVFPEANVHACFS